MHDGVSSFSVEVRVIDTLGKIGITANIAQVLGSGGEPLLPNLPLLRLQTSIVTYIFSWAGVR
jgi:hypothetical protein